MLSFYTLDIRGYEFIIILCVYTKHMRIFSVRRARFRVAECRAIMSQQYQICAQAKNALRVRFARSSLANQPTRIALSWVP